jgi:H+/Cl- antiporter ClcA
MKVEALTESAAREKRAPKHGTAIEHAVIDAAWDAPVPWLLALIPVGLLVVAGLLLALLAWFARPTVTPSVESSLADAPDLGLPTTDEVKRDGMWHVGPTYSD